MLNWIWQKYQGLILEMWKKLIVIKTTLKIYQILNPIYDFAILTLVFPSSKVYWNWDTLKSRVKPRYSASNYVLLCQQIWIYNWNMP